MKINRWSLRHAVRGLALSVLVICGLASTAPFATITSYAAEPFGLKNVTLRVDPEYDDAVPLGSPSLLMMVDGEIVGTTAPATIRFMVPSDATLYSAGSGPRSQYIPPSPVPARKASSVPGWDEVSYNLQTQFFVFEYYQPISAAQPARNISFDFRPLYPVSNLQATVQEPRRSTFFSVTPAGTVQAVPSVDSEGFNIRAYNYSNVDPTVTPPSVHFDISYSKSDNQPSSGNLGGGAGNTGTSGGGLSTAVLILLILVGLAVVAVAFILLKSKFSPAHAPARTNIPRRGSTARLNQPVSKAPGAPKGSGKFCNQCGQQVEAGAQFCPYCGNKLRS